MVSHVMTHTAHVLLVVACLLLPACALWQKRATVEPSPTLDPALVGVWEPRVLSGGELTEDEAAQSAFVIRPDGVATLVAHRGRARFSMYQQLQTAGEQVTITNLISRSRKSATQRYKLDGDRLTIGEGDTRQEYVRRGDLSKAR